MDLIEKRLKFLEKRREVYAQSSLKFGITFLDDALEGITKRDLIVLGSETGAGKTEFATHFAKTNANDGKNVLFYALEAEPAEIEMRIQYKLIAQAYYAHKNRPKDLDINMSYRNYYVGKNKNVFDHYAAIVEDDFVKILKNLHTIYKIRDFTFDSIKESYAKTKKNIDLIIIDHLHYIDSHSYNENAAITEIMKDLRDFQLEIKKPIILISHLRKRSKFDAKLVPEIDEFHGSSNISKICTKAITVAPDFANGGKKIFSTFIRPAKFRVDGSVKRYIGQCFFDVTKNAYDDQYNIGKLSQDGSEFEQIIERNKLPSWVNGSFVNKPRSYCKQDIIL